MRVVLNDDEMFVMHHLSIKILGSWDVSNVTDMRAMFYEASSFNQDISSWDVSSVTNMYSMFSRCISFQSTIGSWDVSNVTNMKLY